MAGSLKLLLFLVSVLTPPGRSEHATSAPVAYRRSLARARADVQELLTEEQKPIPKKIPIARDNWKAQAECFAYSLAASGYRAESFQDQIQRAQNRVSYGRKAYHAANHEQRRKDPVGRLIVAATEPLTTLAQSRDALFAAAEDDELKNGDAETWKNFDSTGKTKEQRYSEMTKALGKAYQANGNKKLTPNQTLQAVLPLYDNDPIRAISALGALTGTDTYRAVAEGKAIAAKSLLYGAAGDTLATTTSTVFEGAVSDHTQYQADHAAIEYGHHLRKMLQRGTTPEYARRLFQQNGC